MRDVWSWRGLGLGWMGLAAPDTGGEGRGLFMGGGSPVRQVPPLLRVSPSSPSSVHPPLPELIISQFLLQPRAYGRKWEVKMGCFLWSPPANANCALMCHPLACLEHDSLPLRYFQASD